MKLPGIFQSLFKGQGETREVYVSLYLDTLQVAGSFFTIDRDGVVHVLASRSEVLKNNSWEERGVVVDEILGMLEEKTGHTDVTKAILGLPPAYLTDTGEIQKDVRVHIKQFMAELELKAIGFVPLQQAIIYKMRFDEGVPPSVILLGINSHGIEVGVYKVGELSGVRQIEKLEDIVGIVEQGLRSFTDIEVLPARILLYGSRQEELEDIKAKLLKHQWTSKVNFLHFPKIETISEASIVESISFAGASELGAAMTEIEATSEDAVAEVVSPQTNERKEEISTGKSDTIDELSAESDNQDKENVSNGQEVETLEEDTHIAIADVTPLSPMGSVEDQMTEEVAEAQEVISEDFSIDSVTASDDNVVMVDAESLGFKKDVDVLEEANQKQASLQQVVEQEDEFAEEDDEQDSEEEQEDSKFSASSLFSGSKISSFFAGIFSHFSGKKPIVWIALGIIVLFILLGSLYWFLPHATVTVLQIPKSFETTQVITIDPVATTVDAEGGIVPGRKRDKAETGEKTVQVNGKKNVGDPAKGSVTIYNKAVSSKTFKKGSLVSAGSLQFTLDEDVQVASASESIGSLTFGKSDVRVTAVAIGTQSNITSGSEFNFKDIGSTTAIARNEKAFSGGTSREITVVSRADYDAFVKTVSEELIQQAKQGFNQVVTGSEKIIDATIKTTVTEKVFNQEIDEEAKQLQGKLTVTISGIAYTEADVRALLSSLSSSQIPTGYTVNDAKTTVTVSNIQIKKDGKITAKATMSAYALPTIDVEKIQKDIAGKNISFVKQYVQTLPGVGGVELGFSYSPTKGTLPLNKKNILVRISVME